MSKITNDAEAFTSSIDDEDVSSTVFFLKITKITKKGLIFKFFIKRRFFDIFDQFKVVSQTVSIF